MKNIRHGIQINYCNSIEDTKNFPTLCSAILKLYIQIEINELILENTVIFLKQQFAIIRHNNLEYSSQRIFFFDPSGIRFKNLFRYIFSKNHYIFNTLMIRYLLKMTRCFCYQKNTSFSSHELPSVPLVYIYVWTVWPKWQSSTHN